MVDGLCEENFLDAKNIFEESINSGFELGGAICIEVKGKKVLDLWGGHLDHERTEPWQESTIVNVFSTTKGIFEKAETKAKAMAMAKENLFND